MIIAMLVFAAVSLGFVVINWPREGHRFSLDGATKLMVNNFMRKIPYRLLATATAAPNDSSTSRSIPRFPLPTNSGYPTRQETAKTIEG